MTRCLWLLVLSTLVGCSAMNHNIAFEAAAPAGFSVVDVTPPDSYPGYLAAEGNIYSCRYGIHHQSAEEFTPPKAQLFGALLARQLPGVTQHQVVLQQFDVYVNARLRMLGGVHAGGSLGFVGQAVDDSIQQVAHQNDKVYAFKHLIIDVDPDDNPRPASEHQVGCDDQREGEYYASEITGGSDVVVTWLTFSVDARTYKVRSFYAYFPATEPAESAIPKAVALTIEGVAQRVALAPGGAAPGGAAPAAAVTPAALVVAAPPTLARAAPGPADAVPEMWMRGNWDPGWDAGSAVAGVRRGGTWGFVLGGWAPGAYLFKFANALEWPSSATDPRQVGLFGACTGTDMAAPSAQGTACTNASQLGRGGNLKGNLGPNVAVEFTRSTGQWAVLDPGAAPAFPPLSISALWLRGAWSGWDAAGAIPGVASGHDWAFKVPDTVPADAYAFKIVTMLAPEGADAPGAFGSCHGYDFVVPLRRSAACPDAVVPTSRAGKLMAKLRPGAVLRFNDQTGAWSVTSP